MLRKGLILGALLLVIGQLSYAQTGLVDIRKDSLINLLQEFRAESGINPTSARLMSLGSKVIDKKNATRVKKRGFRVQIFSGSDRSDAYATQSKFQSSYKDISSYVSYDEPNYRVKVGDFRSRNDANSLMKVLRSQYSNVFVFIEDIWVYE